MNDIRVACLAIADYLSRTDAAEDLIFDAIRMRLIEIGEATKDLTLRTRELEPSIPWGDIARLRDHLAHRYFDTTHSILSTTARNDIPALFEATERLAASLAR
ncbi:DUF86 domain-containing protein [Cryobacterium frigoriphilum]|uniref:HepT-like ribonuclease domain-containing protein n=1 Tax=Cryobacterium frigoriphilum TaxID=1259150 RepID=UPI001F5405AC|nr:HepT-like ribonuclease domain-containing protein [Cryobacterium frigoriphilum]